jgi:hypothetical protein
MDQLLSLLLLLQEWQPQALPLVLLMVMSYRRVHAWWLGSLLGGLPPVLPCWRPAGRSGGGWCHQTRLPCLLLPQARVWHEGPGIRVGSLCPAPWTGYAVRQAGGRWG